MAFSKIHHLYPLSSLIFPAINIYKTPCLGISQRAMFETGGHLSYASSNRAAAVRTAVMELMAVDGVVAIETFSDMDMTWLNGNFNFRIQYMEVRKRTIVLAIWILGIFPSWKIGQKYMESVPPIERAIDLAIFVDSEYGS